jgi:hypothetical protein
MDTFENDVQPNYFGNFQLIDFDQDFKQEEKPFINEKRERFGESALMRWFKVKDQRTRTVTRNGLTIHLRRGEKRSLEYQCWRNWTLISICRGKFMNLSQC